MKLKNEHLVDDPDDDGAITALGNDTMRPTSAAVRPRSNVLGPIATRSDDVDSVAMRITGHRRTGSR